jgi:antitoxin component YwqK of YwqJK toxin-antitoxin module
MSLKLLYPFLLFLIVGCSDVDQNTKTERYPNGGIKFIKHYDQGKIDGQAQWFYPNGTIEQIVSFENGKENGNAYYYYNDGALKHFRNWKDGKMIGYANDFFDSSVWVMQAVLFYNDSGKLVYKKSYDGTGKTISEERSARIKDSVNKE